MANYKYVISHNVFNQIDSFYEHVALKYINTYSYELMANNITESYSSIYRIENGLFRRRPTISKWTNYHMANTDKWYFAYRIDGDTIYVEDACHAQNMQTDTNPSANYSANTVSCSEFKLPPKTRILKGTYYGGLKVAYYNRRYTILTTDGNPLVKMWFNKKPIIFRQPFGEYNIIAHVSYNNFCYAIGIDGKIYDMNRLWDDAYLSEAFMFIVGQLINETLRTYKRSRLLESKGNIIRMNETQLVEIVQTIINRLIA